jgi:WS/DGAT/MGAT family acyltransferase
MAQQHLDRLTAVDASFLAQEGPASHMHIGGIVICEGPAPGYEEMLDHIRTRLHLVPRYRQRLAQPPLETGRPLWVDDPTFNLEYHVRQTALPAPGAEDQLMRLVARIMSQQLDRSKPLWEMWIVEGLDDGGFAVISKTHHALIDGISGVDLATVMFDLSPVPVEPPHPDQPWQPHVEPTGAELVAGGAVGLARVAAGAVAGAVSLVRNPSATFRALSEASQGLGEVAWAGLNPAPETPLNVEIGPHRRYCVVRNRLADFKEVKNAFGGTVNDVVLTVVTGALRDWLHSRGVRTEGLELRALVPVSTRGSDERGAMGNRITVMRGPLPVYIADPVARLRAVKTAMDGLKESKQAVGAEVLTGVQSFAPPTILAQASRLNFSTRLFNLIVTNVPGPQLPLYVLGRKLEAFYPQVPLVLNTALGIAIMSYDGKLFFGLLGDYDAMDDIDDFAADLRSAIAELGTAAGVPAHGGRRRGRARPASRRTKSRA